MTTELKNYNLLREFNLEQAKAGETILYVHYRTPKAYVEVLYRGCTKSQEQVYVEYENGTGRVIPCTELKMKPLCWIEGKPVYKGDSLYYNFISSKELVVAGALTFEDGSVGICTSCGGTFHFTQELTWDKPKEPNVHQELIDAYNKGAEIQYWSCLTQNGYEWKDISKPSWCVRDKYRIKPKKKSGWINLWKANMMVGASTGFTIYPTKDAALNAVCNTERFIETIEIHWEE